MYFIPPSLNNKRRAIFLTFPIVVFSIFALGSGPVSAAPKSKSKTAAKSKAKTKPGSKGKAVKADEREIRQLNRAHAILKPLSPSKKSALTKLLKNGKKEDLIALPGVGEVTANAIIKARPLKSTSHLILVRGIGEKRFKQIVDSRK